MRKIVLVLTAIRLIISCTDNNSSEILGTNFNINIVEFENIQGLWKLEKIQLENNGSEMSHLSEVTLEFQEHVNIVDKFFIEGNAVCNQYGGQITKLEKGSIKIVEFYTTEALCSDTASNEFEALYYELLSKAEKYMFDGTQLLLFSEDNTMIFNKLDK